MLIELFKYLTPLELKVLLVLLVRSQNGVVNGVGKLSNKKLSLVTLTHTIEKLRRRKILEIFHSSRQIDVMFQGQYKEYAEHLKKYETENVLKETPIKQEPNEMIAVKEIIMYYAKKRGVTEDNLKVWCRGNFGSLIKSTVFLLDYVKHDMNKARAVLDMAAKRAQENNRDWSMQGDVVRNIDIYTKEKGEKKWTW